MTKKLSTFKEVMQKMHYWVDLFKQEQSVRPSKIRASRLLFLYTNVAVLLKDATILATDGEHKIVEEIQSLIPSQESLLALFLIIEKKSSLSSKDLGRFSVETRTLLLLLRNEDKLKEKKQMFQDNLEQIIVLLQPFV
ncbi:TPA: hypothetical protein DIC40_06240 [Patescibacteria group bacterium]|nr:hypothetical protein P148_SR1C00001G0108 [candidate division SR1 bacterium RAAC1_SR1_1]HCY21408.1 hypothetical protein [Candidatus Gracilibacteria bacterium]